VEAAKAFLKALDPSGIFTFQTFDDDKNRKDGSLARVLHGTLDQHLAALTQLQQRGAGVFVMVNEGDGKGRSAKNVVARPLAFRRPSMAHRWSR
jgi:UDP-glucose 4-epimerase